MTMSYAQDPLWRQMQQFLPPAWHIAPGQEPTEDWWPWQGHRVHLTATAPQAAIKVILLHGVGTNGRQMSMILGRPLAQRGFERLPSTCPNTA